MPQKRARWVIGITFACNSCQGNATRPLVKPRKVINSNKNVRAAFEEILGTSSASTGKKKYTERSITAMRSVNGSFFFKEET